MLVSVLLVSRYVSVFVFYCSCWIMERIVCVCWCVIVVVLVIGVV